MKKTSKKLLAIIMSVVMVIGLMVPITVVADYELNLYEGSEISAEYEMPAYEDDELIIIEDEEPADDDELAEEQDDEEASNENNEEPSLGEVAAPPSESLNNLISVAPHSTDQFGIRIVPHSPSIPAGGDTLVDIEIVRLPGAGTMVWENFTLDITFDSNVIEPMPIGANPNIFVATDVSTWLGPDGWPVNDASISHRINPENAVSPGNTIRLIGESQGERAVFADVVVLTVRFRSVGPEATGNISWGIFNDGVTAGGIVGYCHVAGSGAGLYRMALRPAGPPYDGVITVGALTLRVTVTGNTLMPENVTVSHGSLQFTRVGNVFSAPVTSPITGNVTASAPRFQTGTAAIPLFIGGYADVTINLDLLEPEIGEGVLVGMVSNDVTNAPIPGATVTVFVGNQSFQTVTDAQGLYRIIVPEGSALVAASALNFYSGFAPNNPVTIVENQESTANIRLQPNNIVGGGYHLTVNVTGVAAGIDAGLDRAGSVKDPNSNAFVFTTAAPLTGTITAFAPGYLPNVGTIPPYVNNMAIMTINLSQEPVIGAGIQGRVTNVANGNAIAGATVVLLNMAGNELSRTTTGTHGEYSFNNLNAGYHRIIVSSPGFIPQSRDVEAILGQWVIADFALERSPIGTDTDFTLVVNLVNIGNAPGAQVFLTEAGVPRELELRNGIWSDTAMFPLIGRVDGVAIGFLPASRNLVNADFNNPARLAIVNLTLQYDTEPPLPGVLRGFVRIDPASSAQNANAPVAGATVIIFDANGNRMPQTATTDATGFYSIAGLPAGTYTVTAQHPLHGVRVADEKGVITMTEGAHVNVYLRYGQAIMDGFLVLANIEPSSAVAAGPSVTVGGLTMYHSAANTWERNLPMTNNFIVQASAPSYVTNSVNITPASFVNNIASVTIRLQREMQEGVIQGYVFEAGVQPELRVPFASVSVVNNVTGYSRVIEANYDGFFRFEGLALGSYTLAAWSDDHYLATSPTPVVLVAGAGVHRNIEIPRRISGPFPAYNLMVTVVGLDLDPDVVVISMAGGTTLQRVGTTNVWQARSNSMMLGVISADAPRFRAQTRAVIAGDYVDGEAFIVIALEEIDAIIRLFPHYPGGNPAFYYEIEMPDIDIVIPANLRPELRRMYGTVGDPGWAFLGWYDELFANMHLTTNTNRITSAQRLTAIDLLANLVITEALLDANGVFELHGTWVRFGDVNGDGIIDGIDRALMQNFILSGITNEQIIVQTANLNPDTDNLIDGIDRALLQNHILSAPGVILGHIQQP